MCVSVCQFVNTLTAELVDVRLQNLVQELTLMTSRTSLMVKVKGHGHPVEKCNFRVLAWVFCPIIDISAKKVSCAFTRRISRMRRQILCTRMHICARAQTGMWEV